MSSVESSDFIAQLENITEALKECQNAKQGKESCSGCENFFSCDLRRSYVKAAYDKMCEGEDKGFAF